MTSIFSTQFIHSLVEDGKTASTIYVLDYWASYKMVNWKENGWNLCTDVHFWGVRYYFCFFLRGGGVDSAVRSRVGATHSSWWICAQPDYWEKQHLPLVFIWFTRSCKIQYATGSLKHRSKSACGNVQKKFPLVYWKSISSGEISVRVFGKLLISRALHNYAN